MTSGDRIGGGLVIREFYYDQNDNLVLCCDSYTITVRLKCGYHIIEEELSTVCDKIYRWYR